MPIDGSITDLEGRNRTERTRAPKGPSRVQSASQCPCSLTVASSHSRPSPQSRHRQNKERHITTHPPPQEGREFFTRQPASKELACELPGSLGLGQSYVRPPKTLEGQENRTCSDCCTKRPPYVFFVDLMRSCQEAGMYVCMYVCV